MKNKKFGRLLQSYVNKGYDRLLRTANDALGVIAVAYKKMYPEKGAISNFILPFIAKTVMLDGQYTEREHKFLNGLLEGSLTYEEGKSCMQAYSETEIHKLSSEMIEGCGESIKNALLTFCLCFTAVDETITHEESEYLANLLA